MGHYNGISAIGNTSYASWVDGRDNNFGSYTGYYPDFAMFVNPVIINLATNDSSTVTIKIPAVNGPYSGNVIFNSNTEQLSVLSKFTVT